MMVANTVDQKIKKLRNHHVNYINNKGDRSMGWERGDYLPTFQAAPLFQIVTSGILGNVFPPQLYLGLLFIAVSIILQYKYSNMAQTCDIMTSSNISKSNTYKFYH